MLALAIGVTGCAPTDGDGSAAMTDADRASIQQQLFQMGDDWSEAYETGDLTAFDRIFADDFIYTVTDGVNGHRKLHRSGHRKLHTWRR